ncbi:MAG: protein kinase [Anaerolineales bacterium]|nr:protein kinase [Anaerolineales bacterium]
MKHEPLAKETILKTRYRIVGIIAKGGMGAVYRAFDQVQQKPVAIKENYFVTQEGTKQFKTEAEVLRRLRHPGLPGVTEDFTENRRQYLVMELIEGQDLAQIVKENGLLNPEQALDYLIQVCRIVDYLHQQNIIHRDIKPQNIKITYKGQALLVDFGIAKIAEDGGHTALGAKAVTEGYSPPEQYSGHTDARSDIYALGATLYTLLTGQKPPASTKRYTETEGFVPPEQITPGLNPDISRAIMHAMELKAVDRPLSVASWQDTLEGIQKGRDKLAPPKPDRGPVRPTPLPPPQPPSVWKWLGLAAAGLVVIGVIFQFWRPDDNDIVIAATTSPIAIPPEIEILEAHATPSPITLITDEPTLTATITPIVTDATSEIFGTVTANIPLYEAPSNQAGTVGRLTNSGQVRIVSRTGDDRWLEIDEPAGGWVMAQFIEVDASLATLPVSPTLPPTPISTPTPTFTPTSTPSSPGPIPLALGGGCNFYTLRSGGNQWFTFSSDEASTAMIVAFIQNEMRVELFVYNQNQIVNGRLPANPDAGVSHLALLSPGNGRDGDANTKDIVWAGGVTPWTQYYVRIANRSPHSIGYYLAPSDVFSCP